MPIRIRTEAKLLDAAEELFFTRGIAATPVDQVLARAGVSAATLYRGFPSKEALVAAALDRRHRQWLATWDRAIAAADTDQGRVLAIFDALDEFRGRPGGARWCAFLGSAAEYADPPPEVAAAIRLDGTTMRERLTELAAPLAADPAGLAERLLLVVTGALAMRLREPGTGTTTAREVAAALIAAAARPARPGAA